MSNNLKHKAIDHREEEALQDNYMLCAQRVYGGKIYLAYDTQHVHLRTIGHMLINIKNLCILSIFKPILYLNVGYSIWVII